MVLVCRCFGWWMKEQVMFMCCTSKRTSKVCSLVVGGLGARQSALVFIERVWNKNGIYRFLSCNTLIHNYKSFTFVKFISSLNFSRLVSVYRTSMDKNGIYRSFLSCNTLGPVHTNPFSNENGAVMLRFQRDNNNALFRMKLKRRTQRLSLLQGLLPNYI